MKKWIELSKEVSYALRHAPWEYGLEMDEIVVLIEGGKRYLGADV